MRRTMVILCASALFAAPAWAQEDAGSTTRVTGFAAPGMFVVNGTVVTGITPLRVGGMVETVWSNGLGFAIDASYLTTFEEELGNGIAMIAPAILYEFHTGGPVKPYVRGGPSFLVGQGDAALRVHFGGGVNYWIKENFGLKVEGRYSFLVEAPGVGITDVLVGAVFKF